MSAGHDDDVPLGPTALDLGGMDPATIRRRALHRIEALRLMIEVEGGELLVATIMQHLTVDVSLLSGPHTRH